MTAIPTVTGTIDSSEMGRTLVHEHVFVVDEEYRINYQDDWDEDEKWQVPDSRSTWFWSQVVIGTDLS